jgi:prepilin-type N-terminal cleavage/methylation domain-containing protein
MKNLSSKKIRGFALMEVLLAVTVIALASFGVYKLYTSASESSRASQTVETLTVVHQAYTEILSEGPGPTTKALLFVALAKKLPATTIDATNLHSPYGPFVVGDTLPPLTIATPTVLSKKSARKIALQSLDFAKKVLIGTTPVADAAAIDTALKDAREGAIVVGVEF